MHKNLQLFRESWQSGFEAKSKSKSKSNGDEHTFAEAETFK